MYLRELAHARAGDKGDTAILSVFPLDDQNYQWLVTHVTTAHVKRHLARYISGEVMRYDVPSICGLQFVCTHALDGGVTTSLALDSQGKYSARGYSGCRFLHPPDGHHRTSPGE